MRKRINKQEAATLLRTIRDKLLAQGKPARSDDDGTGCRYRLPVDESTVLKCAVGVLIPVDAYDKGIEGATVTAALSRETERGILLHEVLLSALPNYRIDARLVQLLYKAQRIHDGIVVPWGDFKVAIERGFSEEAIRCMIENVWREVPR